MASEGLFAVLPETVGAGINDDLVVAGLEGDGFVVWMRAGGGEGVHVGFCDVLYGDGDIEFPGAEGFVVGGCD